MHLRPARIVSALGALVILAVTAASPLLAKPAASIPASDLIQPEDLAALLLKPGAAKPLILQVGFRKLYAQAHIPNAEYVGAGEDDDGLKALSDRVAKLPKDASLVIYCGCCPWSKCPNIAAAYDELHALGFKQIKVLYIAKDFGTNWVDAGYPTTLGS
ncbi:MAG: rhodanese-like domain-containing protein [Steroidobacteraceae bacterium]|jgi:rhodanese-related sulfurtransferase